MREKVKFVGWFAVWIYGASPYLHSWPHGSKKNKKEKKSKKKKSKKKRSRDMHAQMTGSATYYGAKRAISFEYVFLYFGFEVAVRYTL